MADKKQPAVLSSADLGFDEPEDDLPEVADRSNVKQVKSEAEIFPTFQPGSFGAATDIAVNNPITTPIFRALDRPAAAVRAGIKTIQDSDSGFVDKLGEAGSAAYQQLFPDESTPEAPRFKDIIQTDMEGRGYGAFAEPSAKILGPVADVVGDPLNLIPIGGAKAAKALPIGEAVDFTRNFGKLVPEGEFFANAVPEAAQQGSKLKDKMISTFLGPAPESIQAYRANPELINKAPGVVFIKDKIDESVRSIKNMVSSKEEAKNAAKTAWDESYKHAVDTIKSQKPPQEMRADVAASLDALRAKVSDTSSAAFDVLDRSGITIPSGRLKLGLAEQIRDFKSVPKITPEGKAAVARLEQIRLNMDELPDQLTGAQAKAIIQELDAARQMAQRSGEYMDKEEQIKQLFRGSIDEKLKQLPEYREIMEGLSSDTRFLKDASKALGDERTLMNKLSRIHSPGMELDRKLLSELGLRTGQDFETPISTWLQSQELLKSKDALEKIRNALPEAQSYQGALLDFDNAKGAADEIVSRLGQGSTEKAVKSVMQGNNIETARAIDKLQQQTGINFAEMIQAEKVARDFKGGNMNGSRNVNLMGGLGEAAEAGMVKDVVTGRWGQFAGKLGGAYIDKFGKEIAKNILDKEMMAKAAMISTNGKSGIVKSILKSPLKVSPGLMREFLRPEVLSGGQAMITDKNSIEEIKASIMADNEMSSIEKAKALNQINTEGSVTIKGSAPAAAKVKPSTKAKTLDDLSEVFK